MILVVDDEKIFRESFVQLLSCFGYQADAVGSGEEALVAFDENKYRMIITDNHMPGMGGIALIRTIKQRFPLFPVIALTAASTEGLVEAGATRCFTKPFDFDELTGAIRELERLDAQPLKMADLDGEVKNRYDR